MTVIRTTRALLACAVIAAAGAALAVASPASAAPRSTPRPVTTGSYYLALGDSVPFGYREANSNPTPDYPDATTFQGYPEIVGKDLGLKVANAACPGETSSSFINIKAQSNGCEADSSGVAQAGYRTNFPLHESYTGSQLVYADNFLKAHPNTKLISLMIGANDGFICQTNTDDHCQSPSEITPVVQKIAKNVNTIVSNLRGKAGYQGQIVLVNYYSTDFTDTANGTAQTLGSRAINNGLDSGAKPSGNPYKVRVASGFTDFRAAAKQTDGDDCAAGLLTILPGNDTCGVHPSVAGQNILANSVVAAIGK